MHKDGDAVDVPPSTPTPPKPGIPPGTPDWWGHADAPWDTLTIQRWVDQIDAALWHKDGNDYWKALPCPRCTHGLTIDLGGGSSLDYQQGPEGLGPTTDETLTPAWCNCKTANATHPGRPEGTTEGCGQSGHVNRP